ncbi:Undecaprenyl-diphosphatase [Collimonas sp. OK607]|uniref:undecaprenyl-diphosphatase n=1 Tax=Collimonas sp. OK607 TaxID=1798194 RepID=UPI0008F2666D|nr:undecaprenyl-diphosphatase [Collimonas sp. OK607]SFB17216.1 Undecaprenyl-diphosphatase [Collimonas sp. OK607]
MEELNQSLFLLINASAQPSALLLNSAMLFAEWLIFLIPAGLLLGWFRGGEQTRKLMLEAVVCGVVGLSISALLGVLWQHPRPFMIDLGTNFLAHSPDSSFPSDHLTLQWSVAFSLLLHPQLRKAGAILSLLGLPMAWARIYLGVHFPLDMLGAAIVAALSAGLCLYSAKWFIGPLFKSASFIHGRLFAPFIRRGWMLK